jgi:hypothetical protein
MVVDQNNMDKKEGGPVPPGIINGPRSTIIIEASQKYNF